MPASAAVVFRMVPRIAGSQFHQGVGPYLIWDCQRISTDVQFWYNVDCDGMKAGFSEPDDHRQLRPNAATGLRLDYASVDAGCQSDRL
jgi:hypothetical protein